VDRTGSFPRAGIEVLARVGVLGATSAAKMGGAGGGLAEVGDLVGATARECASTAMVLLMRFSGTRS
jgi:isovaleryl-CoA dehydrogenase